MREKRFCLQCDDGTLLKHGARDMVIVIDDLSDTVSEVLGWHCPVCGDCQFDVGHGQRYGAALAALRQRADQRRAESVRSIRKKLGLKQAEAGRLFGGGVAAFSEYERGKTQPHKSTVLLLKLLEKHPDLLKELLVR